MADNYINDNLNQYTDTNNQKLYEFNKNYISYISQCTGNNAQSPSTNECSALLGKLSTFDRDLSSYIGDINNNPPKLILQNLYGNKASAGSLTTNNNHDKIIQQYGIVTKQRSDLDAKLRELYDIPGSKSLDFKYNYDSTIYSGILLTIIASGVVYYTFTKL